MLKLEHVSAGYGDAQVLFDVSLQVNEGEIVALVGANGAGKSTLLKAVSGVVQLTNGEITFAGKPMSGLPAHAVPALGIAHVPEGRQVFPQMSVLENLMLGGYTPAARGNRAANLERLITMFPRLRERQAQMASTLSGGEQQMLAIARGLMLNPRMLLLDEPSLGLAPKVVSEILETVRQISQNGVTVLLVDQNVQLALQIASRAYILETGRIALQGAAQELLHNSHVRSAYLGL